MKILHVINSMETGGAQRLVRDMLPRMAEGSEVSVVTLGECGRNVVERVLGLRQRFREVDVVHAHLFPSLYLSAIAASGLGVKLVFTEHSTSNRRRDKRWMRFFERWVYGRYNRVVSISEGVRRALLEWLGVDGNERFVVIDNGVDLERFSSLRVDVEPDSMIMVSRFVPAKDQETVIRALALMKSDAVLVLVGDGPGRSRCEDVAFELGLADRVRFMGECSDVAELMAAARIGVQSSVWEGFGLTAVELMACGKPVLGTDVDGLRQVIDGAGLLFKVGDAKALAEMADGLLEDETRYSEVATKCRERAELFDIKKTVNSYLKLYYEVVSGDK
ncbi:MAG: glycosyltransferase [Bacteroidales bacterium]|nr:glycosyltransferase [Bacteroidales bacterium]